jgi:BASS family bile acid:Na+ symporter
MQTSIYNLLTNRNFILIVGLAAGLIFGDGVAFLKDYTPYILGTILAVSVSGFSFKDLLPVKKSLVPIGVTILVNYFIYGAIILGLAALLTNNPAFWLGFVVIAATPPAIAVIPFSINLKGDANFSIIGIVGGNVAGIVLAPLTLMLFAGDASISPVAMLDLILKILVIPILASRLLRWKKIYGFVEKQRGIIIDYLFLLVAMTVIGISRNLFIHHTTEALIPFGIMLFMMFGMGYLLQVILNAMKITPQLIISNKLILVMKNAGFASVMAISLFDNPQVVLPAAILSVLLPVYYLVQSNLNLLGTLKKQQKRRMAVQT